MPISLVERLVPERLQALLLVVEIGEVVELGLDDEALNESSHDSVPSLPSHQLLTLDGQVSQSLPLLPSDLQHIKRLSHQVG